MFVGVPTGLPEPLSRPNGQPACSATPAFHHVQRWRRRTIPQYEVGHARFADLAAGLESEVPGLALAGNWIGGISVSDAIAYGAAAAARLLAR